MPDQLAGAVNQNIDIVRCTDLGEIFLHLRDRETEHNRADELSILDDRHTDRHDHRILAGNRLQIRLGDDGLLRALRCHIPRFVLEAGRRLIRDIAADA